LPKIRVFDQIVWFFRQVRLVLGRLRQIFPLRFTLKVSALPPGAKCIVGFAEGEKNARRIASKIASKIASGLASGLTPKVATIWY
jgi:hypothetical protein